MRRVVALVAAVGAVVLALLLLGPIGAAAVLAIVGGLLYRQRVRRYTRAAAEPVDDDMIRRIEQQGRLEMEEPTDLDEVRREEERFWSESWDQPEEF